MKTLEQGDLHFIRCLKPNDEKAAESLGQDRRVPPAESSGLVHAVQASRAGAYSDHLPPSRLVAMYGPLFPGEPFADGSAAAYGGDAVAAAESLLACCDVEEDRYAVGRTRLFLRQGVLGELERRRLEYIGARAATVQATARGMIGRRYAAGVRAEAARAAEEQRARDAELVRRREEEARRRREAEEAARREEEEARRREEEARERAKQVQKARAMSFERRRKKKAVEEEELKPEGSGEGSARLRRRDGGTPRRRSGISTQNGPPPHLRPPFGPPARPFRPPRRRRLLTTERQPTSPDTHHAPHPTPSR